MVGSFLLASTITESGVAKHLIVDGGPVLIQGSDIAVLSRDTRIDRTGMTVLGDPLPAKTAWTYADRPAAFPRVFFGVGTNVTGAHVLVDGGAAGSARSASAGSMVLYGTARITDVPAGLAVTQDESGHSPRAAVATPTFFGWRGTGDVALNGSRYSGARLAVVASRIDAAISRVAGGFAVTGTGEAAQVAVDGAPKLRTTMSVTGAPPTQKLTRGGGEPMTWTEADIGPWEAIVTAVRALNAPAMWVRLGVDATPSLDVPASLAASEPHCTSAGAFAEDLVCAQLAPGQAVDTPLIVNPGTYQTSGRFAARFQVFGNFPTVTMTVTFTITPR